MKRICLSLIIGVILFSCNSFKKVTDIEACVIAQTFVKEKLPYPDTAEFDSIDCAWEPIVGSENRGMLTQKFTTDDASGIKIEYIYTIEMSYTGGKIIDKNNWIYTSLRIKDINGGEQFTYNGESVIDLMTVGVKSIKILDYDCDILKQSPYYIRICTPIRLTEAEIREWLGTFENDRFIYLHTSKTDPDYAWVADDNSHTFVIFDD